MVFYLFFKYFVKKSDVRFLVLIESLFAYSLNSYLGYYFCCFHSYSPFCDSCSLLLTHPQDGKVSQLEHVFIRGSKVRYLNHMLFDKNF
jgi:hypothetical protein